MRRLKTIKELEAHLGISTHAIHARIRAGKIAGAIKIGKLWYFGPEAFAAPEPEPEPDKSPKMMNATEVAAFLNISPATAVRRIKNGEMPGAFQVSKHRWRVDSAALSQWISENSTKELRQCKSNSTPVQSRLIGTPKLKLEAFASEFQPMSAAARSFVERLSRLRSSAQRS
ncbi:putative DNA-binding transcriptional regulator AlpA [Rhodoblastus acidophilus]|uniref:helix-turn-helix domain-containing protein n=1 Tax=Rhodoblastus acidophilus TaxID=1074 RepID=UPI002224D579|nr:helix-turn-helix domain-containing protein [Rhodoblastus acidophilus]MCW2284715.1 putative DNA-binding transcriptional regulator AlpA [Rhodoblastus acidophilus]MCW2333668.1 putative DNA-binding transcriptional regulator AlpA [Rhodoblastus acidophilus]